jgi:hypothetical protein
MKSKSILVVVMVLVSVSTVSATLNDGLIANFSFNGNANDETGGGHNGTVYGATLTTDRFGNANKAYSFDGTDDYIDVANPYDFGFNNQSFSISAWVQIAANDDFYRSMVCFDDYINIQPHFTLAKGRSGFHDGRIYAEIWTSSGQSIPFTNQDGDQLPKNQWLHLVSIVDCGTNKMTLYLDNALQETVNLVGFDYSSAENLKFYIGDTPYQDERNAPHNGLIDDVRIYDRALTEAEVGQLYTIPEPATLLLLGLGAVMLRNRKFH